MTASLRIEITGSRLGALPQLGRPETWTILREPDYLMGEAEQLWYSVLLPSGT